MTGSACPPVRVTFVMGTAQCGSRREQAEQRAVEQRRLWGCACPAADEDHAFSSEVVTGSRQENASTQELIAIHTNEAASGFIGSQLRRLGRPDPIEELLDLGLQMQALARQRLRGGEHAAGGFTGLAGALGGVADVDGDVGGTAAAARTLWAMFWVAPRCCSTAAEIEVAMSLMRSMVWPIALIALTESSVASCILVIWLAISSVALAVWPARLLTSCATTAKPRPASLARAASIVAFSAANWSARRST